MSFEQEKMIVGSLPSLYPLQKFEEEAINALVSLPIDDDTISRAKAIEALDKRFDSIPMEQTSEILMLRKDLRELPPAQHGANLAEVGTDCISRQAAIDLIESIETERLKGNIELIYAPAIKGLRALPPAQPESDSGRWERHYSRPGVYEDLYWHCSKCGYKTDYQYANVNHRYCPNCGRKMEREVSDE